MRPTLGERAGRGIANPVGDLSGDTGIGLATFSYKLFMTGCLQTLRRLTYICLICPAASLNYAPPLLAGLVDRAKLRLLFVRDRGGQAVAYVYCGDEPDRRSAANLFVRAEARRISVATEYKRDGP